MQGRAARRRCEKGRSERTETIISQAFPDWEVREQLGHGAYGQVYRCAKREYATEMQAAIKVIAIPKDPQELAEREAEGMDRDAVYRYYKGLVDDCVREIRVMAAVKSAANVVSIDDFKVIEKTGEIGWYVLIRMELLKSFTVYAKNRQFTEAEVVKLGIDICSALEVCHRQKIIHRDIKPANIMVSEFGDFKLGDFGIARKLQQGMGNHLSSKGTQAFMAPEVPGHQPYDERVDLYSLGLVLYQMLNNGRPPFVDPTKPQLTYEDKEQAIRRRFQGERLPPPPHASLALSAVILRACSFRPQGRFASATEMKQALERVQRGPLPPPPYNAGPRPPAGNMNGFNAGGMGGNPTGGGPAAYTRTASNGYLAVGVVAIVCVIALVTAMIVFLLRENAADSFVVNGIYAISDAAPPDGLPIREGPSSADGVLDTIPAGFFVQVTEAASGSYIRIRSGNRDGWVKFRYLEPDDGGYIWGTVSYGGVDTHAEPNINSKRGEAIPEGAPVTVESDLKNGYYYGTSVVDGREISGWADAEYVVLPVN